MAEHIRKTDDFGVYVNLEQSTEIHMLNMQSLGINMPENLFISDYTDFRRRFETQETHLDIIDMVERTIRFFKEKEGKRFTMLALDSLGALYSIMKDNRDLRGRVYRFFRFLRETSITAFIIMEKPLFYEVYDVAGGEEFLADGIIEMGMLEIEGTHDVLLYIQVVKMRGTSHDRKKHTIHITKEGIHIIGPVLR